MPAVMIQGTGSNVGKSLLVAGLCRAARRHGLSVAPFKPQNMSNNAAVTADGGEIGRAQALQARAAGVAPSVHMNPVLLKPQSEIGAQVVVQGRVRRNADARAYQTIKRALLPVVPLGLTRSLTHTDMPSPWTMQMNIVAYLVYWLIFLLPSAPPSFWSFARYGQTTTRREKMMDAVM